MTAEFSKAIELGLKLSKRIYYGKDVSAPPRKVSMTTEPESYLPTAVMLYAEIYDPCVVDNPNVPSYQPYVYGRCERPTLIPLHMHGMSMKTLIALTEETKHMFDKNIDVSQIKPTDYPCLLTISIGTGTAKIEEKHDSRIARKWGILDWLIHGGTTPLLEIFTQASVDMVDFHDALIFQAFFSVDNYLRIQDDTLSGIENSVDVLVPCFVKTSRFEESMC